MDFDVGSERAPGVDGVIDRLFVRSKILVGYGDGLSGLWRLDFAADRSIRTPASMWLLNSATVGSVGQGDERTPLANGSMTTFGR